MSNALDDINEAIADIKAAAAKEPNDPRWAAELVHAIATKASITGEFPYRP